MNTDDLAPDLATATTPDSNTTSTAGPDSGGPVPAPSLGRNAEGPSPARPSSSALCAAMRRLSPFATKVFVTLVDGLAAGEARKLDHAPGAFMAVSVDCLSLIRRIAGDGPGGAVYAIAHRYEVNGDLVPDPDVEFYVTDDSDDPSGKAVYPTAIDHAPWATTATSSSTPPVTQPASPVAVKLTSPGSAKAGCATSLASSGSGAGRADPKAVRRGSRPPAAGAVGGRSLADLGLPPVLASHPIVKPLSS